MIINDSRMILRYGGDDIVEAFMNCAQSVSFPYKECTLAREWDWELVQWLMEQCCAANEARVPMSRAGYAGSLIFGYSIISV